MIPRYLDLAKSDIEKRTESLFELLSSCKLCPRECGVNRLKGEIGFCLTGRYAYVSSYNLHFGEEDPLVGSGGSGTIFFSGCNLGCVFCQNYEISHSTNDAQEVTPKQLAHMMIILQEQGAHNINFVSPTHVVPQILDALSFAIDMGLKIPLVYNTGSYDKVEVLRVLDGIIDIYMPDTKFFDSEPSEKYLKAKDYPEIAKSAIKEMYRQVGDLKINDFGIAERGLLIRHLLMPNDLAGTKGWMEFIAKEISLNTYINIMDQYRPCGEARKFLELMGTISYDELKKAQDIAKKQGLTRFDKRDLTRFVNLFRR